MREALANLKVKWADMQYPHGRVPPVIGYQNLPIKGKMDYFFNSIQEKFQTNFSIFELVDEPQSRTLTDLGKFLQKFVEASQKRGDI